MVIAGASGHAKEILDILIKMNLDNIIFFDNVSSRTINKLFDFPIYTSIKDVERYFKSSNQFVLALGGTYARRKVYTDLIKCGGQAKTVVATTAALGSYGTIVGSGVNIMNYVLISSSVSIGNGSLINAFSSVHHDVEIGQFCEVSPRATILGGCKIGDFTTIGSSATILPGISIGKNVIIGAGSVVTKNVADNTLVHGVPGKVIRELDPIKI